MIGKYLASLKFILFVYKLNTKINLNKVVLRIDWKILHKLNITEQIQKT